MKTLSDKIFTLRRDKEIGHPEDLLVSSDVKEFIRELIKNDFINTNGQMIIELRKLAGDKLI